MSYRQVEPRALRWTIAATSQHGVEQGTVWFNARDLILKSQTRAYKSGSHGTAQAATVTLTYPNGAASDRPVARSRPRLRGKDLRPLADALSRSRTRRSSCLSMIPKKGSSP